MTITLELPATIEAQLRESAARQDVEGVRRLLADSLTPVVDQMLRQEAQLSDHEFEALADELASEVASSLGPNPPALTDHAVSREGLYEDHF